MYNLSRHTQLARAAVLAAPMLATFSLLAQQGTGNISGTVRDASGAAIGSAVVDIENIDRNDVIHLTTNESGFYSSPPLTPGSNYRVTVSREGFSKSVIGNITVTVGQRVDEDATLKIGAASDVVVVEASQAAPLDTTSGTLGAVIGEKSIEELPLNGRNVIALTTLTPGVRINTTVAQGGFANRGTNLSAISINGSPTGSNSYILDGQSNLSTTTGEIAINPTVDAIQEFKVQSGVFSAQYGFTLGGVVNLVSRSGTNTIHGSVYEFLRNDAFNARNYFARNGVVSKPVLRYNQFGGAMGAPIIKDKAYIFGNFETYQFKQSSPQFLSVPTAAQRAGDFSQLVDANNNFIPLYNPYTTVATTVGSNTVYTRQRYANNQITNIDPVAKAYQDNFYPLPNNAPGTVAQQRTNTNNYLFNATGLSHMYNALGRLDYHLGSKDTVFARYAYYQNYTNGGTGGGTYYPNPIVANRYDTYTAQELLIGDTHVFSSSLINDLRLSIERQEFPFQAASAGQNWPQKLGLPSNVPNFALPTVANGLPASNQTIGYRAYTLPEVTDTVSKVIQRHALSMGVDWRGNAGANLQRNAPSGTFSFAAALTQDPSGTAAAAGTANSGSSYADFLAGAVSAASITTNTGELDRSFSFSAFVQDDWSVTDRLTLNMGLRYDFQKQPYEQNNGYSNFNPDVTVGGYKGIMEYANTPGVGRNFVPESYRDFGPRFGFAYQLTGDGKTVLRGGFGIYYPLFFNSIYTGQTNGFSSTSTSYTATTNQPAFRFQNGFPTNPLQPLGAAYGPLGFLGQSVGYQTPGAWKSPQSQQFTLSVQRQVPYDIVLQVAYVGNHGVHLPAGGWNINALNPSNYSLGKTYLQTQVANPYAGKISGALGAATVSRQTLLNPYPYYGTVSTYNAHVGNLHADLLQISAQRQAKNGLTVLFGYTMGKVLTDSVNSPLAYLNGLASNNGYQNPYNRAAEYSLDPSDVSQRATVSALYNLPIGKGQRFDLHSGLLNRVVGGIQFNVIGVFQTGTPLTISGANSQGAATRPNYVPGVSVANPNQNINAWFNTAAFSNPSDYTFGNVPRSLPHVRGPGTQNFDFSIFKTTDIYGRFKLQLRGEAFNVLNHPNFGLPGTGFAAATNPVVNGNGVGGSSNTSSSFGVISTAADGRSLQLAGKIIF